MDPIFAAWSKSNIRPIVRGSLSLLATLAPHSFNRGGGFVEIVLLESHSGGPGVLSFLLFFFSTRFNYPATSFVSAIAADFVRFLDVDPSREEEHEFSQRNTSFIHDLRLPTVEAASSCFLLGFLFRGIGDKDIRSFSRTPNFVICRICRFTTNTSYFKCITFVIYYWSSSIVWYYWFRHLLRIINYWANFNYNRYYIKTYYIKTNNCNSIIGKIVLKSWSGFDSISSVLEISFLYSFPRVKFYRVALKG